MEYNNVLIILFDNSLTWCLIMTVIEVANKDMVRVFEILLSNGRFAGLPNNRFRIDEHPEQVIERMKKAGIDFKILTES